MTESSETDGQPTPYQKLGGEPAVRALAERFYDAMEATEPDLAALHQLEAGKVSRASRDRFALFLIGWLGGPQEYMRQHGHPRLRMRHARVPVNNATRDAWLRCMQRALADDSIDEPMRLYLTEKLSAVADFLRNEPE